jgi:CheY-like chemotaxis protein
VDSRLVLPASAEPARVLVAEDDAASRRRLEATLQRWGFDVVAARDGKEALEQFRKLQPQIVLLDWLMPELDGVDVCREIRALPEGESAQLILVSSRSGRSDVIRGLESGADAHLAKPWQNADLRAYLAVAGRVLRREATLKGEVTKLEGALRGQDPADPISMCSYCRHVLAPPDQWMTLERYLWDRTSIRFSHGVCPGCFVGVKKEFEKFRGETGE